MTGDQLRNNSKWPPMKVVWICYTIDENKQIEKGIYALQKVQILHQQTLLKYFKVTNRLQLIIQTLFTI